jgi:flavorubredoxin
MGVSFWLPAHIQLDQLADALTERPDGEQRGDQRTAKVLMLSSSSYSHTEQMANAAADRLRTG